MRTPIRRHRGAEGAAAVEFALVMPILFLIMFGILQYGLYFNDSLSTRQGVREAARLGVVRSFTGDGCSGAEMTALACRAAAQINALTGTEYVRVKAASWAKGEPLVVCAYVKTNALGYLPMPDGGWIFSKTQMSIEQGTPAPATLTGSSGGTIPSGGPTWPTECG